MTPKTMRLIFPLRAPRALTLAWWPVHVYSVAVDAFFAAFFAVLDGKTL